MESRNVTYDNMLAEAKSLIDEFCKGTIGVADYSNMSKIIVARKRTRDGKQEIRAILNLVNFSSEVRIDNLTVGFTLYVNLENMINKCLKTLDVENLLNVSEAQLIAAEPNAFGEKRGLTGRAREIIRDCGWEISGNTMRWTPDREGSEFEYNVILSKTLIGGITHFEIIDCDGTESGFIRELIKIVREYDIDDRVLTWIRTSLDIEKKFSGDSKLDIRPSKLLKEAEEVRESLTRLAIAFGLMATEHLGEQ